MAISKTSVRLLTDRSPAEGEATRGRTVGQGLRRSDVSVRYIERYADGLVRCKFNCPYGLRTGGVGFPHVVATGPRGLRPPASRHACVTVHRADHDHRRL